MRIYSDKPDDESATLGAIVVDDPTELARVRELLPIPEWNTSTVEWTNRDTGNEGWERKGAKWFGPSARSRDDVNALLDRGWPDGASKAQALALDLEGVIQYGDGWRRRTARSDSGDELDADRALAGQWDTAWETSERVRMAGGRRIVTLCSPLGGNCNLSHEQLFWQGAQMVAIADLLEGAGYAVEAWAVNLTRQWRYDAYGAVAIRAKAVGEPVRMDMLANTFANAAVFRTAVFDAMARLPVVVTSELGSARHSIGEFGNAIDRMAALGWLPKPDVYVGEAYTREDAIASIRSTLAAATADPIEA